MNYCLYIYVNIGDDIKQFDFTDVSSACDDDERKKTLKVSQLFHLVAALKNTSVLLELNWSTDMSLSHC